MNIFLIKARYGFSLMLIVFGLLFWVAEMADLYFFVPWFDEVMHFAGGVTLGFLGVLIGITTFPNFSRSSFNVWVWTLFLVVLLGVFWEVFEFSFTSFRFAAIETTQDSPSDVAFDLLGGLCALSIVYASQVKRIFTRYHE